MRICRPTYPRSGRPRPGLRAAATAASLVALAGLPGCGTSAHRGVPRTGALTVYSSLPRAGVDARAADAVAAGERLALADVRGRAGGRQVRLVELDSAAPGGETWDPAAVEANARRAADDPTAIAYIGELDLGGSAVSVPVTSAAGILQVSPEDGLTSLTRSDPAQPEALPASYYHGGSRNFVRLVPSDADQAAALVAWARQGGARRVAIVRDDRLFGRELASEASLAARRQQLSVTSVEEARRGDADYVDLAHDVAVLRPDAVLYTGLGDADSDRVLASLHRALPAAPIYGSSALAAAPGGGQSVAANVLKVAAPASAYGARAREVLRRLREQRGMPVPTEALYGYDAMRLVLDAVEGSSAHAGSRAAVVRAAFGPRRRRALAVDWAGASAAGVRFARYRRAAGRLEFLGLRESPVAANAGAP